MATKETLDLLLSHTQFAKLSATEQYHRLIAYYARWFESNFDIHAIDNIRATQRLTTYARLMNIRVGVALLTLLTEASAGPSAEDKGGNTTFVGEPAQCVQTPAQEEPEDFHREILAPEAQPEDVPTDILEPAPESDQPAPKPQARSRSRGSKAKAR